MDGIDRIASRVKLRDLQLIKIVVEEGSMAKAASRLNLTQSGISKSVADLERLVGMPLLNRLPRGVEPTECGRVLIDCGRVAFDEIRQGVLEIETLSDPNRGQIRIGTTEAMAGNLADIIHQIGTFYPKLIFEIEISDTANLIDRLRDRNIDVVWTRWTRSLNADDLLVEKLFQAPLVIMAHKNHKLARKSRISPGELSSARWTLSPSGTFLGRLVEEAFLSVGQQLPRSTITTISIYMRLNLVATGEFLTVLPNTMLRHPANRDWLRSLNFDLGPENGAISLIAHKGRRDTPAIKLFRRSAAKFAKI